jgi:hypothetical protein
MQSCLGCSFLTTRLPSNFKINIEFVTSDCHEIMQIGYEEVIVKNAYCLQSFNHGLHELCICICIYIYDGT